MFRPFAARWPLAFLFLVLTLGGCAGLAGRDPLDLHLVGIEPLPAEDLEMRFAVKLRVQNPNDVPIQYDGVALELELDGNALASGVSARGGSVPRFGEALLVVPVSVSAFAVARQALGLAEGARREQVPYVLRGKLAGAGFGSRRFSEKGTLRLPAALR